MLQAIKWEFKKILHSYGYYALALIGLVLLLFVIPNANWVAPLTIISVALVFAGICLMFLPQNNVMLMFKQPGFAFERQRSKSAYVQLMSKLSINIILTLFTLIILNSANFGVSRFESFSGPRFFYYQGNEPIGQILFEMSIFYPLVFLCLYYWLGRTSKVSHGILSGILCFYICGTISTSKFNLWIIIVFEILVSVLLFFLLGKWIEKMKEPYC